jgi:hypothetical protein
MIDLHSRVSATHIGIIPAAGTGGHRVGQVARVGGVQRPIPGGVAGFAGPAKPGDQREGEVDAAADGADTAAGEVDAAAAGADTAADGADTAAGEVDTADDVGCGGRTCGLPGRRRRAGSAWV